MATFGDAERVGALMSAAARTLGGDQSARQTVLGDGAGWIKTQAALHFPVATTVASRPGAAHRALRRHAHQAIPALLWGGDVDGARAALQRLVPTAVSVPAVVTATLTYLHEQRSWIGDYEAWRAAGEPVGSGMVEREVARVINRRMKRQGMRWRRANADAVVALRVSVINDTWDRRAA